MAALDGIDGARLAGEMPGLPTAVCTKASLCSDGPDLNSSSRGPVQNFFVTLVKTRPEQYAVLPHPAGSMLVSV